MDTTYLQLKVKSNYNRKCALHHLSNAAKEINSSAKMTSYFGSNALHQKHSSYSVSREIDDALIYFNAFHQYELAIKKHQKECREKFTNKRFKK